MAFIVDTCVWIDVERGAIGPADVAALTHNEPLFLSPVTIAELKYGAELGDDPRTRQKRLVALRRIQRKPTLAIDSASGEIFGDLAAQIRASGRHHRYRIQDLWLASQAIQHAYRLLTRNKRDFADIAGLDLVLYELPAR